MRPSLRRLLERSIVASMQYGKMNRQRIMLLGTSLHGIWQPQANASPRSSMVRVAADACADCSSSDNSESEKLSIGSECMSENSLTSQCAMGSLLLITHRHPLPPDSLEFKTPHMLAVFTVRKSVYRQVVKINK